MTPVGVDVSTSPCRSRSAGHLPRVVHVACMQLQMTRAMEEDLVVALPGFLVADEFERVAQRLNRGLDRDLDVLALQLHSVDFALDVLEARLRPVEKQIRPTLGVVDD